MEERPGSDTYGVSGSVSVSASEPLTATPFAANPIAGSNASRQGRTPPVARIARQPATAPGTVIGTGRRSGTPPSPVSGSASARAGERPLELMANVSPSDR